jgi:1,4-alpha-glucan branching enzyme
VLNAHFPYVRHAGRWPHGEEALHAVIAESYVPLLAMLLDHQRMHGALPLTVSISPVLLEQLADPHVMRDVDGWITGWHARVAADLQRFNAAGDGHNSYLARFYGDWIDGIAHTFRDRFDSNLLAALRSALGSAADVLLAPATYAYLPHLSPPAVRAQVKAGALSLVRHVGRRPAGLWLPGGGLGALDGNVAKELQLRYAVAPAQQVVGTAGAWLPIFAADRALAEHVHAPALGYGGDGLYREFYRHDPESGIAYWRVTSMDVSLDQKAPYDPYLAFARADEHAAHWVGAVVQRLQALAQHADTPTLVLAFDAELFGHGWFEGVHWLRRVLEQIQQTDAITLTTVGQLEQPATIDDAAPATHPLFDDEVLFPLRQQIAAATDRFVGVVERHAAAKETTALFLTQAARELLLAQASDWAALIATGAAPDYAERREREHLDRLDRLLHWAEHDPNSADAARYLHQIAAQDNLFPFLNYRVFA